MIHQSPDEQRLSAEYGALVYEVPPDWMPPFQPWVVDQIAPVVLWWAWQRDTDSFTPVYARNHNGHSD